MYNELGEFHAFWEAQEIFTLQTPYAGYVLAIVFVVATIFLRNVFKRKSCHWILWVPVLLMLLFCLRIDNVDISAFISNSELLQTEYSAQENDVALLNAVNSIMQKSVDAWTKSSYRYILATLLLSILSWTILKVTHNRYSLLSSGACVAVLAMLLMLCLTDRYTVASAKLFYNLNGLDNPSAKNRYQIEYFGQTYFGLTLTSLSNSDYEIRSNYVLTKDIPVYVQASVHSEQLCVLKAGSNLNMSELMLMLIADEPGWRYSPSIYPGTAYYDENGFPHYRYAGYMRIDDILSAINNREQNGVRALIARQKLLEIDACAYVDGVAVSPSIMHVFVPFEIYLLAPLTAIFAITWVVMLIKQRRKNVQLNRKR